MSEFGLNEKKEIRKFPQNSFSSFKITKLTLSEDEKWLGDPNCDWSYPKKK